MPTSAMDRDAAREREVMAAATWVQLLARRAESCPSAPAYTYLADGEQDARTLSYGALDRSARALAASLQDGSAIGERALLLVPPGPEFVVGFFACLYAGLIAVPVPLPTRARGLPRLLAIVRDCRPSVMLSNDEFARAILDAGEGGSLAALRGLRSISVGVLPAGTASDYREPEVNAESLAFLQYTSGSTGTPKGVVLSHRNLLHNQQAIRQAFQHTSESVVVGWLPPFHDMGLIGNLLQPLFVGAHSVQMAPAHFLMKPWRWLAAISRFRATTSGGPNFSYDLCVQKIPEAKRAAFDLSSWQVAFNGAEPVRSATLTRFAQAFAVSGFHASSFYPCYGLAEATLLVSGGAVSAAPTVRKVDRALLETGRIGRAQEDLGRSVLELVGAGEPHGADVRIVEPESGRPCADGTVGEIWVLGASVARGYWERPDETAHTFAARLSTGEGPFLRTGDLGCICDGELFVTGRLKDLIIVRGRNLYPQDLELAAEQSHASLPTGGGAAFAVEHADGAQSEERVVIVHEVSAREPEDWKLSADAIARAIADRFEVAVHAVVLIRRGSLPRTTSGKVRRRACRERFLDGSLEIVWSSFGAPSNDVGQAQDGSTVWGPASDELTRAVQPARTALELQLAVIWAEVLERSPIRREQEFLSLGGDSLKALQVCARVHELLDVELSPAQLFETTTIASLAAWMQRQSAGVARAPECARPDKTSRSRAANLEPQPMTVEWPLSRVQERLWFLEQLVGGKPVYHIAGALRLEGVLEPSALERAVSLLVARHEALRTSFHAPAGRPFQRVEPAAPIALPVRVVQDREQAATVLRELGRPFDLRTPPVRWLLVRLSEREHVLGFSCHHLLADGWSAGIVVRELVSAYRAFSRGAEPALEPLGTHTADFARQQGGAEAEAAHENSLAYWRAQFARAVPALELPSDRPRAASSSYAGARQEFALAPALVAKLGELGRSLGATPFMTFAAGLAALLYRYTAQPDLCIGAPVAVRPERALQGVVGCFLNTLALRMDLSGNPELRELVTRVRATVCGAQRHRQVPFERVLQACQPERRFAHAPLFQVMLSMQPPMARTSALPGLAISVEQLDLGTAQFDLSLDLTPDLDGSAIGAAWEYNTDLFDAATIRRLSQHLLTVLEDMVARPTARVSELSLLSEAELLAEAREPAPANVPLLPVHMLFESEAQQRPDREAVICGAERLSYAEVNAQANRLARHLRKLGVRPETRVGIYFERSPALIVSALAVLKAGGGYVPIDPGHPAERVAFALADAQVAVLVTNTALAARLPESRAQLVLLDRDASQIAENVDRDPSFAANMHQLAYVLYTSGSTGRPKGVMVTQQSLAQTFFAWEQVYLHGEKLRLLQLASPAFDVWTADWVRALCTGGCLVMAARELALDAAGLTRLMRAERITAADLVPALVKPLLEQWQSERAAVEDLRVLIVGSDVWSLRDYQALRRTCLPDTRVLSCYGLTEATIDSAWFEGAPDASAGSTRPVPLGWAFPGTRLYVLDQTGQRLPRGVPGELAIGGLGVARGYLRQPALTAQRFRPDPFAEPGARLYRTGDRVRMLADGTLEFLGRVDDQVKLRGVRIEIAEIEAGLRLHPDLREAAVVPRERASGERELVAYVVMIPGRVLDSSSLRQLLRGRLPEVMVPSAFVQLEALPLGANGKVDRRALPAHDAGLERAPTILTPPRTELEQAVAEIFASLLARGQVGVHENFFDLGGHSLLLAELQSSLRARTGTEVPMLTLLEHPTVASLAALLSGEGASTSPGREQREDPSLSSGPRRASGLRSTRLEARAEHAEHESKQAASGRRAELLARRRRTQESE